MRHDQRSTRRRIAGSPYAAEIELLELRQLMSVTAPSSTDFSSIDGTGNNLAHPDWGAAGATLLREAVAAYGDGVSTPAGATRPSARAISNAVSAGLPDGEVNDRNLAAFVYAWGQFLDHDIDLTPGGATPDAFNIPVPVGDLSFDPAGTGLQVIPLNRSTYDPTTGMSASNPRQQINVITAWIDGSVVYGSDPVRAAALRTFVGGKLKTSAGNLLPFNDTGLPNANDAHLVPDAQLFLAGDVRANENVELSALQTLFMREHNRIATSLAKSDPSLSDETLYQETRKIVAAEIQSITYNEFLPALLGQGAMGRYHGYNSNVNPGIANEFSTAAFRVGHTMLGDDIEFLDANGNAVRDPLPLSGAFFNPGVVEATGIDPILKYLASDRMQEIDPRVVDGVRNFLFGAPGAGGFDLAALNIQRGRDHGLADYNTTRAAYGLPRVTTFAQITSDPVLQSKLQALYGSVDNVDLWVGALAEDHVAGGSVGALDRAILVDQFNRLRDGDRFWYQNQFTGGDLAALQRTTLADIIRRNTALKNVQSNVFVFNVALGGTIYSDLNRSQRQDRGEMGLSGWTVQVLDATGAVVASTMTTAAGRYTFTGLDLGSYQVEAIAPTGWTRTTSALDSIDVTRGTTLNGLDLGFAGSSSTGGGTGGNDDGHRHYRPRRFFR